MGFFVLPYPIKNNVRSVYIPHYKTLVSSKNQKEIANYWSVDKFDLTSTSTYKQLVEELNQHKLEIDTSLHKKSWIKIEQDFTNAYKQIYGEKLQITFNVYLVNYRTTVNVLKVTNSGKPTINIALRKDSDISEVITGILIGTTGALQNTFYGPKWYNSWEENISNVDYIKKYTVVKKFFKDNKGTLGTLDTLRESANLDISTLNKASKEHLSNINLSIGTTLSKVDNKFYFDKKPISNAIFTTTESKTLCVLLQKQNDLVTYDEIAKTMWDDNEDKFSYWAISKHINRIKNKLKAIEGGLDKIVAKRGEGYILIN